MPFDRDWANQVAIQQLMGRDLSKEELKGLQQVEVESEACGASHAPEVIGEDGCIVCGYRAP